MPVRGDIEVDGVPNPECFETVIVGAGQAGLAVGYHLAIRQQPFVLVDANQRIGDSWRHRWESLRLFTPASLSGLPGWPFPAPARSFPTKDEMADYLEAYARRFDLSVLTGIRVDRLHKEGTRFVVISGDYVLQADNVVVATGPYQRPNIPAFAPEVSPDTVQLHSSEYRDPSQLLEGEVLVVGAATSGTEIALELSRTHRTLLSGDYPASEPTRPGTVPDQLLTPLFWFLGSQVLHVRTPIGRTFRRRHGPKLATGLPLLVRIRPNDIEAAGIERVPTTVGVRDGSPLLQDGRTIEVSNIIWCTGFRPDFGWIGLPVFDDDGLPVHERGVVGSEPGLYFVGLFFLSSATSALVGGVGRDAQHIARHIVRHVASRGASQITAGQAASGPLD